MSIKARSLVPSRKKNFFLIPDFPKFKYRPFLKKVTTHASYVGQHLSNKFSGPQTNNRSIRKKKYILNRRQKLLILNSLIRTFKIQLDLEFYFHKQFVLWHKKLCI